MSRTYHCDRCSKWIVGESSGMTLVVYSQPLCGETGSKFLFKVDLCLECAGRTRHEAEGKREMSTGEWV